MIEVLDNFQGLIGALLGALIGFWSSILTRFFLGETKVIAERADLSPYTSGPYDTKCSKDEAEFYKITFDMEIYNTSDIYSSLREVKASFLRIEKKNLPSQ